MPSWAGRIAGGGSLGRAIFCDKSDFVLKMSELLRKMKFKEEGFFW